MSRPGFVRDPYLVEGPALIRVSGGRTSAFMLRKILDAHGGKLPKDVVPIFCNTGREHPRTYDFLQEIEEEWCRIVWLEYVRRRDGSHDFQRVLYSTAARKGEPFDELIQAKGMLPNPMLRFCTSELKIRTGNRYAKSLGWSEWDSVVGLRADEPWRVAKLKGDIKAESVVMPMAEAGHTLRDVHELWKQQVFDLHLPGGDNCFGNCDGCFLKSQPRLEKIARNAPELLDWWVKHEENPPPGTTTGARFRSDRPSYADILKLARQPRLFDDRYADGDDDSLPCMCTD